jgi:uncharacterized protein (TIGR03437 family)
MRFFSILLMPALLAAGVNYSYDAAGRLIKIDYGSSGSITYSYDKAGNLLSRVVSTGASTNAGTITSVSTAFAPASSGIAQNTWTVIKGNNLVPATTASSGVIWSSAPDFAKGNMPTQLNGIGVSFNGKPGYIYFFCSAATDPSCTQDQINVLTPLDSTVGDIQVVVTNGATSTPPFTATLHALVPAIFNYDGSHTVATHLDNSRVGPPGLIPGVTFTPAAPGEQIVVYGSGFGIPPGVTLTQGSASQFGQFSTPPVCTIGGDPATLAFAGLVSPGLVQMNINVPKTATSGDKPVSCTFNGAATPPGNVITISSGS